MTTYVVRFLGAMPDEFRGRVRHVSTGEEDNFTSPEELYDFLERMNVSHGPQPATAGAADAPDDGAGPAGREDPT